MVAAAAATEEPPGLATDEATEIEDVYKGVRYMSDKEEGPH